MSKKFILTVGALMMGAHLHAMLIGAFDFTNLPGVLDNATIESTFSDLSSDTNSTEQTFNDLLAGNFVTLNTTGVTDGTIFDGSINSAGVNDTISSRLFTNTLSQSPIGNLQFFGSTGSFFEINVDLGGARTVYDLTISYAASAPFSQLVGITWEIIGTDDNQTITTSSSDYGAFSTSTFLSGEENALNAFVIRGTLTGPESGFDSLNLDNIQLNGTVVPEPSTYAAIAGVLVLGFVAARRRMCK